ncbi:MAG TPA: pyridoxal phosphate-dependent aminotransferase [bacterium]|nr:pyridoxal phosphate-dependent aminotransferase [bacterium]
MLAERMSRIDSSGIRKVFDLAQHMKDPVNFSIGQPDFDVPEVVKEAAIQALESGFNRYTLTAGIPELREACLAHYRSKGFSADGCIITSGVSGGILLALLATMNPGDEILVPDPYFVMYKHLVNFMGGVPIFVDTYPGFELLEERLEAAVTPKTKAIFVNSPANPTGKVASEDQLRMVARFAERHSLLVISDEIYEVFNYIGENPSIATFYPNTIVLNGFSKIAAMTGWRVGYALASAPIIKAMTDIQQYTFVCAPSFAQKAALAALDMDTSSYREEYRRKRDQICEGLGKHYEIVKPEGAFYVFPRVPEGKGTDEEFVKRLIENNVLCIPGSVFSQRNTHLRLSYAATDETIERGIEIMCRLADE